MPAKRSARGSNASIELPLARPRAVVALRSRWRSEMKWHVSNLPQETQPLVPILTILWFLGLAELRRSNKGNTMNPESLRSSLRAFHDDVLAVLRRPENIERRKKLDEEKRGTFLLGEEGGWSVGKTSFAEIRDVGATFVLGRDDWEALFQGPSARRLVDTLIGDGWIDPPTFTDRDGQPAAGSAREIAYAGLMQGLIIEFSNA